MDDWIIPSNANCKENDVDDIEDILLPDIQDDENRVEKNLIFPKNESKFKIKYDNIEINKKGIDEEEGEEMDEGMYKPGKQKIFMKTFGCSHNVSDSEYMQGILASYGYEFTDEFTASDLVLVNSCTVKDPSQAAFMNYVKDSKTDGKGLVVAGCVPQGDRKLKGLEGVSMVGVQQIDRVVEVVEETLKGRTVRLLGKKKSLPRLDLPKIRKNPIVEIIPLSTGCLGNCTYCKTKHARGALGSYDPDAIVARAKQVIDEGVAEIWLSSEDTGAYGKDINTSLSELLYRLVDILPEHVMLRVGMTNPPFILEQLEDIAAILRHPQVFSFLHVPVQSGSNEVLLAMNREYTIEEFYQVVDFLKENVPGMSICTDIICGFPTETEENWQETMALVRKYKLAQTHISQFYPRPGTPAARMKRIRTEIVKDRSREISKFHKSLNPYKDMIGNIEKIWITTEISRDGGYLCGHTKNYVKVLVPINLNLIGGSAIVKIIDISRFHVVGEYISTHEPPQIVKDALKQSEELSLQLRVIEQQKTHSLYEQQNNNHDCECGNDGGCGDNRYNECCGGCDHDNEVDNNKNEVDNNNNNNNNNDIKKEKKSILGYITSMNKTQGLIIASYICFLAYFYKKVMN